jgi:RNA recognition motif-containing protein
VLQSSDVQEVKKLRKNVLLSLQLDESDKAAKKQFKRTIQQLEEEGVLNLDADGTIKLVKEKKKRKRDKEEKKSKKKKKEKKTSSDADKEEATKESREEDDDEDRGEEDQDQDDSPSKSGTADPGSKNKPVKGNPQGVTRLFVGNLPFTVDEASLAAFLPGEVTHIKWITDKETGKFYGSAFVEMDNSVSAADAVAMAGEKLIGRPVKINFAPAREDDVWPPVKKVVSGGGSTGGGGGQAGGKGVKAMSAKPDGCTKLFIGNLSYEIDDEGITKFFANVDAEVKTVRWLHHRDTGDFKGV